MDAAKASLILTAIVEKRIKCPRDRLITQAFPSVTQVAVLMNPKASAVQSFLDAVEGTAKALRKSITILTAGSPDEVCLPIPIT